MDLDTLCVQTIRTLAIDTIQKANSGHPGAPMGCAPMAYTLFDRHLRHDPSQPTWFDRDRFILSAGHASSLLYALLHLSGYPLGLDDLKAFRQWQSRTPGHPENHLTPGVETTTGPLGQGFAMAVGFAIAEAQLAARFNRPEYVLIDHHTYTLLGDGCMMEGVSAEAASLAGHLGLGKLIALYDDNGITIDGTTEIAFTEDVARRFEAYGWHTLRVSDGNNLTAIDAALSEAKAVTDRPSLILVKTHIGYGSPKFQDTSKVHGSPLGAEEIRKTKAFYGWPEDAHFATPKRAVEHLHQAIERGQKLSQAWNQRLEAYANQYPTEAAELRRRIAGELPEGWDHELPRFEAGQSIATRSAGAKALDALHPRLPELFGGSADLAESNKTWVKSSGTFSRNDRSGRNLHFGIREHAMGAICNGLALHGGLMPYGATFLVFSDYMRPAVRLGALSHAKAIWVWTHDSIGLGEDGPTHQPIEHLAALRAIPGFLLFRPADANETIEAWKLAVREKRPVGIALTRQNLPVFDRERCAPSSAVERGAYILDSDPNPKVVLIASGSETAIAMQALETLRAKGIAARVVNMFCSTLFDEQPQSYRDEVLPPTLAARVAIEAGCSWGWERYVGCCGRILALDHFGASAPDTVLYEQFGLTPEKLVEAALSVIES
jgi:transketolase